MISEHRFQNIVVEHAFPRFPRISARFAVVPDSRVLGTRESDRSGGAGIPSDILPQKSPCHRWVKMEERTPPKMADFSAFPGNGVSLCVPLSKRTQLWTLARPRKRSGRCLPALSRPPRRERRSGQLLGGGNLARGRVGRAGGLTTCLTYCGMVGLRSRGT
jgi:hypothetical protein